MGFFTTKQLARRYGVEEADIRSIARLGIVSGVRVGNAWIFDSVERERLDEMIERQNENVIEDDQDFDDGDDDNDGIADDIDAADEVDDEY